MTKIFLTAFCAQENNELLYFFKKETEIIKEEKTTDNFKIKLKGWIWKNIHCTLTSINLTEKHS